jgi:hypothetical protein
MLRLVSAYRHAQASRHGEPALTIYKDCPECKGDPKGVLLATHYHPCKTCAERTELERADTLPPVPSESTKTLDDAARRRRIYPILRKKKKGLSRRRRRPGKRP